MAYELDTERLRRDLEDDYGTAISSLSNGNDGDV